MNNLRKNINRLPVTTPINRSHQPSVGPYHQHVRFSGGDHHAVDHTCPIDADIKPTPGFATIFCAEYAFGGY